MPKSKKKTAKWFDCPACYGQDSAVVCAMCGGKGFISHEDHDALEADWAKFREEEEMKIKIENAIQTDVSIAIAVTSFVGSWL